MKRRQFVGGLAAAAGVAACSQQETGGTAKAVSAGPTFEWSIVTSWPPKFPGLGIAVDNLAEYIDRASGGRLKIKVYAGGELVPPFEVFDAVSRGAVEMGHGASYYHKGKLDAAQFFTSIPFGMTQLEMNGWIYYGGGLELWRELYAPFELVPFMCGNTGVQMGGWFNKEINSVADLEGLKMRIPGLGGEVLRRAGGTPVTLPGSEIFTSLQTGAIDATEWVGPWNDLAQGFYKVTKYYYWPGFHEPGAALATVFNKDVFESLTKGQQEIIQNVCHTEHDYTLAEFNHNNSAALDTLLRDHGVILEKFSDEVFAGYREASAKVLEEASKESEIAGRIYKSFRENLDNSIRWTRISEEAYVNMRTDQAG